MTDGFSLAGRLVLGQPAPAKAVPDGALYTFGRGVPPMRIARRGEACRLSVATLARENVAFRQIPYWLREA